GSCQRHRRPGRCACRRARRQLHIESFGVNGSGNKNQGKKNVRFHDYPFVRMISTRRFFWRPSGSSLPSGLLFGATGCVSPNPLVLKWKLERPPFVRNQSRTEFARRSDNFMLYASSPFESV